MDLNDIIDYLRMVARSVGAEISSPFFYLQFGLILTAAGIALAANAALQARVNTDSLANRWPLPLRRLAHVLVESFSTIVFAVLVIAARIAMYHSTWPSRSYMLVVAAKLALAWLIIRLVTSVIRNAFLVKLISVSAWVIAALSVINQLDPAVDALDSVSIVFGGLRLTPLVVIKLGLLLIAALWLTNVASNFAENRINQSTDLTPSIQVLLVKMIRIGLLIIAVAIAVVTTVLLARALRSLWLPVKALLLNLLSLGAAFGVLTFVWQEGHGTSALFASPATGAITLWVPLAVFALLFGLSMDYEVFILTRINEEYARTGDTGEAVIRGIGRTGRLVTSGALILCLAFIALGGVPVTDVKILSTGLAAGIIVDATIIRGVLAPALVALLGRFNWWLPAPAARLLRVTPLRPAPPARTPPPAADERGRHITR